MGEEIPHLPPESQGWKGESRMTGLVAQGLSARCAKRLLTDLFPLSLTWKQIRPKAKQCLQELAWLDMPTSLREKSKIFQGPWLPSPRCLLPGCCFSDAEGGDPDLHWAPLSQL